MVTEPAGELPEIRKREVSERLEQICPYHTGLFQICTGTRYLPFTKDPTLPAAMQEQTPTTSRFLDALEKKHSESTRQRADAISFASYRKEADHNV